MKKAVAAAITVTRFRRRRRRSRHHGRRWDHESAPSREAARPGHEPSLMDPLGSIG